MALLNHVISAFLVAPISIRLKDEVLIRTDETLIIGQTPPPSPINSVAQSYSTLCNPVDCIVLGFPVHHQLPELVQTYVHQVSDAIQPYHPLPSLSPPAFSLSEYQGVF